MRRTITTLRTLTITVACFVCLAAAGQDQTQSATIHTPEANVPTADIVPGRVISKVDPRYPKEAKKQKIGGAVELIATIDKSGNVSGVAIANGDMILAESAVDAVRNWKFEPYTKNGEPVEVWQKLTLNFDPGRKTAELGSAFSPAELANGLPLLPHGMHQRGEVPHAVYMPNPEFSDAARKAKYQGICFLSLTVGTDGLAHDVKVVQALGMGLDQKALEAVGKWRFQPAMHDGEPIAMHTVVEVSFHLY